MEGNCESRFPSVQENVAARRNSMLRYRISLMAVAVTVVLSDKENAVYSYVTKGPSWSSRIEQAYPTLAYVAGLSYTKIRFFVFRYYRCHVVICVFSSTAVTSRFHA